MAYNKKEGSFKQEDEAIFLLLAKQAGILLKNALNKSDMLVQMTRSKRIISMAAQCIACSNLAQLTATAVGCLSDLLNTEKAVLWIHNREKQTVANYLDGGEIVFAPDDIGIVGQVISTMAKEVTIEPHTSQAYNAKVDLVTELPVVTVPVMSMDGSCAVAVIQFVHLKTYFYHESHKRNQFEQEMIELLQQTLSAILDKRFFSELYN